MLTYTSTKWVNGSGSPLNATNLNNIETGIDALVGAVNTHEGTLESHGTEIGNLKTVDATNATNIASNKENITKLTTDLTATNTTVADHETRVDVLEATVGNSTTGLVKRVTTLESESATKVALKSATDRIGTIESTIPTLATDNELAALDSKLSTRIGSAEQDIIALQNSSGGSGASTWEAISDKPTVFNPTAHATGDSSVYGAATTNLYGHVKISNGDVANTSHANGLAAGMDHTHSDYATKVEATQEAAGLFSAVDKAKLDGIDTGADKTVIVNNLTSDSVTAALSAAQGKALKTAIDSITGDIEALGGGDMMKAKYDTDNNGYVDNADNAIKFDGHAVSEFSMDGHKHEIASVTGLQTALNGKSDSEHVHDYADKAFKAVEVGGTTITADNHQDTLVIAAGSNITLTPDATNDKVTISAKDTTYTFTNKAATLAWGTTSTIATVGGTDITVKMPSNPDTDAKTTSGNTSSKIYLVGATSQSTSAVTTYSHDTAYVGTDGCLYSNSAKVLTSHQSVTDKAATLAWGTTSTIATIGSTNITVKMPANPDTNTHHTAKNIVAAASTATANAAATNGNVYLNLIENGVVRSTHKIIGSGATTVAADANGNITISSTDNDTNTTYDIATTSTAGLVKSGGDITVGTDGKMTVADDSHNHVISNIDGLQDLLNLLNWKSF